MPQTQSGGQREETPILNVSGAPRLSFWQGWLCGGLASCNAELWTLPIDITKVRLQLQGQQASQGNTVGPKYTGMINVAITTVKEEGVLSLWKGLKPALLRQFLYSGLRMGMYEPIRNAFGSGGLASKIGAGVVSGGIAAAIFTPTDLLKIRMQGSSGQKYRGLFHAFRTVVQEEGILGLWKGVVPTSQRAAVVAAAELASYDQCKQFIIGNGWLDDNAIAHFAASFMAGFVATSCSSPIDVVKTRIMNQPIDSTGRGLYYKSSVDCVRKMIRSEGIGSFYRGFFPNWIRLGPWCVVMFMTYEQLKRLITV